MTGQVAVNAPSGRDGRVIEQILQSAGIAASIMAPDALVAGIAEGSIEAAILTEEALPAMRRADVQRALAGQPAWSDLPFLVLTSKGPPAAMIAGIMRSLGHVTRIERPVHAATLVGMVRSALRARSRQRDAERYLAERAQAEHALRIFAERLERRVVERTRDLTEINDRLFAEMLDRIEANDRMNQMQAQLIHVSRVSAMGTMAATLAHELNQPLTAVMNYVRGGRRLLAAQGDGAPAEVLSALDAAVASAHRAGEIVRHVRGLVRPADEDRAPADLAALIDAAVVIGMIDASALGIGCRVTHDPDATPVKVDPIQAQQVLINLLRNAVEAIRDGGAAGEIVVASRRCEPDLAEISVSDNGPGLPASASQTLFSPFNTTKTQGMGIGLSICRTIIEANGGTISGESRPEGGAIFRFTLPLAASATDAKTRASASEPVRRASPDPA